jgi:hypothetical protein
VAKIPIDTVAESLYSSIAEFAEVHHLGLSLMMLRFSPVKVRRFALLLGRMGAR